MDDIHSMMRVFLLKSFYKKISETDANYNFIQSNYRIEFNRDNGTKNFHLKDVTTVIGEFSSTMLRHVAP